ncbi:16462_t:CDS:1, partial [Dentiscutata heterogama]
KNNIDASTLNELIENNIATSTATNELIKFQLNKLDNLESNDTE